MGVVPLLRAAPVEIEMVCRHCGRASFYMEGEVTCEAWRDAKVTFNGTNVDVKLGLVEIEPGMWDKEDFIESGFRCADCQAGPVRKIEDLAVPSYGQDDLGRWLDADGEPHGPPAVHKQQLRLLENDA